ncbi:MAG TPA: substrate-binding domain-containing protein [Acidimicrobiales bacterium]|nr:substrate-binding domain-containing protein [Acidimicrobiales bacterium]
MLAELQTRPAKITNTTPVGKAIPKGKNIIWIVCNIPACSATTPPLQAMAKALDWNLQVIVQDGTAAGVAAAYAQAVREKPDGVIGGGDPEALFAPELAQLKAEGVPVVQEAISDPPGNGIDAVIEGPPTSAVHGRLLALEVVGSSHGPANVLWATSTFPVLAPLLNGYPAGSGGFAPTLKKLCPDCKYSSLVIPANSLATQAPSLVVSYLRAHPSINYVVGAFGDVVSGLPAALAAAGLANRVKVVTFSQNPEVDTYLKDGQISALVGDVPFEVDAQAMDTLARIFTGEKYEANQNDLPQWIITKKTVPSTTEYFPLVAGYLAQYEALWGLR